MTDADPIRVLHTLEPEFGWHFVSPDVHGMVGGGSTYDESRQRAEYLVKVHLGGQINAQDTAGRTVDSVRFVHFVDERATDLHPRDREQPPPLRPPV